MKPTPTSPRVTPAMQQYFRFKERYPDCVLFFRMGDFYEMFHEDAKTVHRVLGLTLTERTPGVPMAGVPYHAVEGYLRKMIQAGYRVAICDQVQDPKEAKGIVDRAVTRVLTPGTLADESLLDDDAPNNLAAVCFLESGDADDARVAIAVVEVSTGAFTLIDTTASAVADELARRHVSELLYAQTANGQTPPRTQRLLDSITLAGTPRPGWEFRHAEALEALHDQYRVKTVTGFGLDEDDPALGAAGAVLRYLHQTQAPDERDGAPRLTHLEPPKRENRADSLIIDATSLRALEVERTMRTGSIDGSLLGIFTGSMGPATAMGRRLLRDWLLRPLTDRDQINARQACVATLIEDERTASALLASLSHVQDVARIAGRLGIGRATPRDLVALGASLGKLQAIEEAIDQAPAFSGRRQTLTELRTALTPIALDIANRCVDNPPAHLREGGLFRDGVDEALDEVRLLQRDASAWLADYQTSVVKKHNLPGIKVGFNRVFGYYIELTRLQAQHAPAEFIRKQTLKNAERYITPELKEFEEKILSAESRAISREQRLFAELCDRCAVHAAKVRAFAGCVAELDCLACFARIAQRRQWVQPEMTDEPTLDITDGAHPVLEQTLGDRFVPNDAQLGVDNQRARLALITGPNMAGKSTYIRQVALIVLLAHTGSFVPASRATIGVTDRIFTRVGADDALHAGQSTFMVEMVETANILHHATARSLVILDEIGRGTSTLDGLSLAWAIAERLAGACDSSDGAESQSPPRTDAPRTLFATHYHELTTLEETLPDQVCNLHVTVRQWGEEIVFLHRIIPGATDQSYGVQVARLAGLPAAVVKRAHQLLETLVVAHEGGSPEQSPDNAATLKLSAGQARSTPPQMSLFTEYVEHPVVGELRKIDLNALTPMQAFDALRSLCEQIQD